MSSRIALVSVDGSSDWHKRAGFVLDLASLDCFFLHDNNNDILSKLKLHFVSLNTQ